MKYRVMVRDDDGEVVSDETHITDGAAVDWLEEILCQDVAGEIEEGWSIEVRAFA